MGLFSTNQEMVSKPSQNSNQTNQFCEGTVIEGEIKSSNDIRLDGAIHGILFSTAKIVIGQKGKVDGEIRCQNADISGNVKGRVEVKDLLFLKATANIEGDIIANKLVVEAGALFNGTCRMGAIQMENEQLLAKEAV
ncbi:MAG TPA: polymer-forming cytoskeletal protein [Chitinophagales bacterium]|nr:polymer-forming cytoskeletal protein [Chitinophagales bacterium]